MTKHLANFIGSRKIKYEPAVEPSKPLVEISEKKEKKFRICCKQFFLTYSRTNISCDEVLNQLKEKFQNFKIESYVISKEYHADEPEKGHHIHVYISFNRKINILSSSKLDLTYEKNVLHGHYEAVKNKNEVISYIKKDNNFITNIESKDYFEKEIQKICLEKGLAAALDFFILKKPEHILSKFKSVRSNLKAFLEHKSAKCEPKYSSYEYPESLLNWFANKKDETTLFLTGPSGTGKTEGIIYLLREFNPLLITELNSLKNLRDDNKAIIFDDIKWSEISRETKIHLFDKNRPSAIKILYQVVDLGSDIIKVVISNNPNDLISLWDEDKAISRRISHVPIEKPLFSNTSITININNIQNNIQLTQTKY